MVENISSETQELECILYTFFVMQCMIEARYKSFSCALLLPGFHNNNHLVTDCFGESFYINNDRESVIKSFELVDKYCRLRLPDEFLKEYDKLQ